MVRTGLGAFCFKLNDVSCFIHISNASIDSHNLNLKTSFSGVPRLSYLYHSTFHPTVLCSGIARFLLGFFNSIRMACSLIILFRGVAQKLVEHEMTLTLNSKFKFPDFENGAYLRWHGTTFWS